MEFVRMIVGQVQSMQLTDYLDIALTAFLIYKLLPVFQAESTRRIAVVVLGVVILGGLTELIKLYSVNFILNQFMTVGLLAVIILFQPELRRILDRLFSVRLRSFFTSERPAAEMDTIIAQTVAACDIMSRERIGALIVFARDDRLEEYFRTGSQIDGMVSEQLLRNIFFPKASLHDGAMIIRDGRVAAAGCVLPLSNSSRLSADLGTRHRAGVGMSEASDAVVVIVSEETGTISVATGGVLKRHLTGNTLQRLLTLELCGAEQEKTDPLSRLQRLLNKGGDDSDE